MVCIVVYMSNATDKSLVSGEVIELAARRVAARDVSDRDMDAFDSQCEWAEQEHYRAMAEAVLERVAALIVADYLDRVVEQHTRRGEDGKAYSREPIQPRELSRMAAELRGEDDRP
jgi:hypothetical protein